MKLAIFPDLRVSGTLNLLADQNLSELLPNRSSPHRHDQLRDGRKHCDGLRLSDANLQLLMMTFRVFVVGIGLPLIGIRLFMHCGHA